MIKKKTTKKIQTVVYTVPVKKESDEPKDKARIINALNSLQASEGWAIIVKILDDNINYLEKCILDKFDPVTQQTLSETEIDMARIKRNLNIELKNTPEKYRKVVEDTGTKEETYDPYYQTKNEIDLATLKENRR